MGIYAVWGPPQSGKTSLAIDLAFEQARREKPDEDNGMA